MESDSLDILIKNGIVVTNDREGKIIKRGAVSVKGGRISEIGPEDKFHGLTAVETIDAAGGIVIPGLINTHTHMPMSLFRGLADDLPLMTWLNDHIFPAEERYMNQETVKISSLLSCAEMLLSGTTTCCDGYFFEDRVAEAVFESGMRGVLGHGVIDFPAPGVPDPSQNVKKAREFSEKWADKTSRIQGSIFCHSPYTCSQETLKKAKAAAEDSGLLFQIHIAETIDEKDRIDKNDGATPVEYLDRIGVLDERTLLVHGVWLEPEDIEIIAEKGSSISHNPESNMKLASGVAPIPMLLKAGVNVGLGTDGCASNNDHDLFAEMDTAAKLHKVKWSDPTIMDAGTVFNMATIWGAKALGLGEEIGSLEIGKKADLVVVNTNKPHLVPMYNPISHLVYAVRGSDVEDVIVDGKILVRNRKLLTLDVNDIMEKLADFAKEVGH